MVMGLNQQVHADPEDISRAATNMKKRQLYKQLSGTDVPWFPHDNAIELLKELCWEAGRPRWIFHGTPAGGAGVHGCLEAGSSVVALCFDEHHRFHLQQFLSERAVEAMVSGTTQVFKDETLQARSIELKLTTPTKTRKPDEKDSSEEIDIEAKPSAKARHNKRKSKTTSTRTKTHSRGQQRIVRLQQQTTSQTTPATPSLPTQQCGRRPPRGASVHRRASSAWLIFEGHHSAQRRG